MTTIYLAVSTSANQVLPALQQEPGPAFLCAYPYLHVIEAMFGKMHYREWVLDSGAFSVLTTGKQIDLSEYIETCHRVLASKHPPREVYALDVIGNWRESLRNTEAMWKAGIKAIPTYHSGEPVSVLTSIARDYPKIAIGGIAGLSHRALPLLEQVFARVWPKRVHCFGMTSTDVLMHLPFDSADATSWASAVKFGNWVGYGRHMPIRGTYYLRPQIDYYLDLERKLKAKWQRTLSRL
jgi:hypothetical protein